MSKMIKIKGREFSEDTIVEALKEHCGFKEEIKAGDVVEYNGKKRIYFYV